MQNRYWVNTIYFVYAGVYHSMEQELISIIASNACGAPQVNFQGFENQFWEVSQALKIKRIIFLIK